MKNVTSPRHVEIDLSDARRVLVGGDVHGHLSLLLDALKRVGYDASAGDRLILLGDLLDRGPDVMAIRDWLDANPTVAHLLGNHCDMFTASVGVTPMDDHAQPVNLFNNGGKWLLDFAPGHDDVGELMSALYLADTDRDRQALFDPGIIAFARRLAASPTAATVVTPGGNMVGLVHGDVPCSSWEEMIDGLEDPDPETARHWTKQCCWSRNRFDNARAAIVRGRPIREDFDVTGIDHVFMGHSITKEPMTAGNCTWIDTGSYKHSLVTVVDVDDWIAKLGASA